MSKADISIGERRFSVACAPGQEVRLEALGERLNARVLKIAGAIGNVGEERLLLVAALALMDELDTARAAPPSAPEVTAACTAALSDAAARIDAIATRIEAAG